MPADRLAWIGGSFCPHYYSEPGRRPAFHDGAALHFVDGRLLRPVAECRSAKIYRLERNGDGVVETAQVADPL
jgi:hypothetical protein